MPDDTMPSIGGDEIRVDLTSQQADASKFRSCHGGGPRRRPE